MSAPRLDDRRLDILDDGTDVTGESDRALVLRAVNSCLATEEGLGKLAREVSELVRRNDSMRPKLESVPDVAELAAKRVIDKRELSIYRWIAGAGLAAVLGELALRLFSLHH